MKMIKKIGCLLIAFFLIFGNTCFADVIMLNEDSRGHGAWHSRNLENWTSNSSKIVPEDVIKFAFIGLLVLIVVLCAVLIISKIIKEKNKDGNNK